MSFGVSVITCTNKPIFMKNIFANFARQHWEKKELIIIVNCDNVNLRKWNNGAQKVKGAFVYQLPARVSLGKCLNFAVEKAKYEFIAKFDDDDYYAPSYLSESMPFFRKTNADVVGKRTYFMYWTGSKQLRLRFPSQENRRSKLVHGGTLIVKKNVLKTVPFADCSLGEDQRFLQECRSKGFRIYSLSKFHYCYVRREDSMHTWKADKRYLLNTSRKIAVTSDFRKFVNRKLIGEN